MPPHLRRETADRGGRQTARGVVAGWLVDADDEFACPGCDELLDVRRPLGVELRVLLQPSMTAVPGPATITVGGVVVHECDPRDLAAETVARRVMGLLGDDARNLSGGA